MRRVRFARRGGTGTQSRFPTPPRLRLPLALAALALCLALPASAFAGERCGWLENPTPGNLWLEDAAGTWIISAQGGPYAEGVDRLPEPPPDGFVRTNGGHGYSCACVRGAFDAATTRVSRIDGARFLPLSACRSDRRLPAP